MWGSNEYLLRNCTFMKSKFCFNGKLPYSVVDEHLNYRQACYASRFFDLLLGRLQRNVRMEDKSTHNIFMQKRLRLIGKVWVATTSKLSISFYQLLVPLTLQCVCCYLSVDNCSLFSLFFQLHFHHIDVLCVTFCGELNNYSVTDSSAICFVICSNLLYDSLIITM